MGHSGSDSNENTLLLHLFVKRAILRSFSNTLAHFLIDRPPWDRALPSATAASPEASIRDLLSCTIKL